MKISTFSIIAGARYDVCNAECPYCISAMTPTNGMDRKEPRVNWRNFEKACWFARDGQCSTAMITGQGEPTLFPDQISEFLRRLEPHHFANIELQTNGSMIAWMGQQGKVTETHLKDWWRYGLNTIAISVVHYLPEKNKSIYFPSRKKGYFDLLALITKLHDYGFSVRLTPTLAKGYIDSPQELDAMIDFCLQNKVEQLTARPITTPEKSDNQRVYEWSKLNTLSDEEWDAIKNHVRDNNPLLLSFPYGAQEFDVRGQNLRLSNCLTVSPDALQEGMRSVIFFPDGHLRYAWQYSGAIIF